MNRGAVLLSMLSATVVVYACVGDEPGSGSSTSSSGGSSSGAGSSGAGSSGATSSSGGASSSGDGSTCTPSCKDASTFLGCDGVEKACTLGCVATGTPHCGLFDPTGPATAADLAGDGLMDLTLEDLELDTTNGRMTRGAAELRAPSLDPTKEALVNGVGYRLVNDVAIIRARSIKIGNGFKMKGLAALTLVAAEEIRVESVWRVPCGAIGGGAGGTPGGGSAAGNEGGKGGTGGAPTTGVHSGGGGGANAGNGGTATAGSTNGTSLAGARGDARLISAIESLRGGGGGGGGGVSDENIGRGGGGGGAISLAAGVRIVIGNATADAGASAGPQGINAGGCGGQKGALDDSSDRGSGAGGGAGGTIVLEAPEISGIATAGIAANGGGGGSGAYGSTGGDGAISTSRPTGGQNVTTESPICSDTGGQGGAGTTIAGGAAVSLASSCTNGQRRGAGGGGSAGFIRVRTKDGTAPAFAAGFVLSPSVADAYAAGSLVVQ